MYNSRFVLSFAASLMIAVVGQTKVLAQGFGGYLAPTSDPNANAVVVESAEQAAQSGIAVVNPNPRPQPQTSGQQRRVDQTATRQAREVVVPTPTTSDDATRTPSTPSSDQKGGYVGGDVNSAIVNPPAGYNPSEDELKQLDQFLERWEEFGRNVKRVSCDVHMREFDGVLQRNSKIPVAHTWGLFRFITPNQFLYHIKGEFVYTEEKPEGEWKEGQNEWMIVLNSKEFQQYDYKNKKVVVYPVVSEEQDMDLTMDNGQFPLFFVAKADVLKNRFYMRVVTPASKQKTQVWIEAFPRYARDAQQFQSITVILSLKDLQPTYMRKIGVNGKSKTDLTFENVQVNKGLWKIEGSVGPGWTKEVREEEFSILRQQPILPDSAVVQSPKPTSAAPRVQTRQARASNSASSARSTTTAGRTNGKLF